MIEFSSQKSENAATLAPPPVWFVLETMTYAPPRNDLAIMVAGAQSLSLRRQEAEEHCI